MDPWERLQRDIEQFEAASVLDILIIAAAIYLVLLLLRGTTAMSLLRGIVIVLVGAVVLVQVLNLEVLSWLLRNSFPALLLGIPIIFQQEIRRFLERVGRTGHWRWPGRGVFEGLLDIVSDAALSLASKYHGALIVIERETGLEEYMESGVKLDASCSRQLLESIFFPNSVLHDGAVVLRGNRVMAAGCILPLSDGSHLQGMRHRAALGAAERTDAVAVVVSEQTGEISVAANGRMLGRLDAPQLRAVLRTLLIPAAELEKANGSLLSRLSR